MIVAPKHGNFWLGTGVMFVGHLLLGWIPLIGGFIVGLVGGKIVGTRGRALLAALFPSIVGVILTVFLPHLLGGPAGAVLGIFVGLGILFWTILNTLGLMLGAFIGGSL